MEAQTRSVSTRAGGPVLQDVRSSSVPQVTAAVPSVAAAVQSRGDRSSATVRREDLLPQDRPPTAAKIVWNARVGLLIEASNASLRQILQRVATLTGATLQANVQDQRVFGTYGPGPGCDVLSQLLAGSEYNVLLRSDGDTGAPREIVLSPRVAGAVQTAAARTDAHKDREEEPPPEPPRDTAAEAPPAAANPYSNGAPTPSDPVQFMQEILERQQVIDQQQQQQKQKEQQP